MVVAFTICLGQVAKTKGNSSNF